MAHLTRGERKRVNNFLGDLSEYSFGEKDIDEELKKSIAQDLERDDERKARFRLHSKEAMYNYMNNGKWSNLELIVKEILEDLGLRFQKDFFHNFKLHNEVGNGYFELDFILPDYKLVIEADGNIWHKIGESEEKDRARDKWLKRLGFETLRLPGEMIERAKEEIKNEIKKYLKR